ncbi:hypothetical protein GMA1_39 [Gordonia phage GMA1]|uniref:excisionase n=1 Tax=Gordonia phage GMA1 TaxID=1647470 RepID=UPI0007B62D7E|nr:excisionase [Gordonia phage GMA1]AKJ72136.1 hypothetical protein GMA1_39 [Gordonia phage GMA1]
MTESVLIFAEEISARLGGGFSPLTVKRKMASLEWPHTKAGRSRGMTEAQFQETLALLAVPASEPVKPRLSGVSPRSRMKPAS